MKIEIYEHNKLIGIDIQRKNGTWYHRWYDENKKKFKTNKKFCEGRAKNKNNSFWLYVPKI